MHYRFLKILLIVFCVSNNIDAQKYFVSFTDKNNSPYSTLKPEEFLSDKAIQRRTNQNINIIENDLPVNPNYIDGIKATSAKVYHASKWLNGVIVETSSSVVIEAIKQLAYVEECKLIWKPYSAQNINKSAQQLKSNTNTLDYEQDYGLAWDQTETLNGQDVHEEFNGEGISIAILDAGFNMANTLPSFQHLWDNNQIIKSEDFVNPGGNVFQEDQHGMKVLSIIGGYLENEFKGSAIKAKFFLYRTEDAYSEYPIEEYNWVCAAERADSIGADIISSSLGYYLFDDSSMDYSYADMDGQTSTIVKGAEIAFTKGMIVINSAGNEGNKAWKYIISPADGENVLSVGAIDANKTIASFSSLGPSSDGRIKPDLVAVGVKTGLQSTSGSMSTGNGTSFSTPVITGFTACVWQAFPELSNIEIINKIKQNAHLYQNPNSTMGYGIPNYADIIGIVGNSSIKHNDAQTIKVINNPFSNRIELICPENINTEISISLYNIAGLLVINTVFAANEPLVLNNLNFLKKGIYILQANYNNQRQSIKLTKK